jgi:hypothetical protein
MYDVNFINFDEQNSYVYIYMQSDKGNKHCMFRITVANNRLTPFFQMQ